MWFSLENLLFRIGYYSFSFELEGDRMIFHISHPHLFHAQQKLLGFSRYPVEEHNTICHEIEVIELMGEPDDSGIGFVVWRATSSSRKRVHGYSSTRKRYKTVTSHATFVVWFKDGKVVRKEKFNSKKDLSTIPKGE